MFCLLFIKVSSQRISIITKWIESQEIAIKKAPSKNIRFTGDSCFLFSLSHDQQIKLLICVQMSELNIKFIFFSGYKYQKTKELL